MEGRITITPIGYVEEGLPPDRRTSRYTTLSTIRLYDEYKDGLKGLEDYSHAFILYWMDRSPGPTLLWRPWKRSDYPEVGVFSTRFPGRPNPIALTLVEIVDVDPPLLRVKGLDAWPMSPVIDIKPYDYHDIVCCPRVPGWVEDKWRQDRDRYRREAPWMGPCC